MQSAKPAPSSAGTSPERTLGLPSAASAPTGAVSARGAGAPAVLPQVEAAQRLGQLLDGAINIIAGAGSEQRLSTVVY